ncbi:hypothetical protein [Nonomuraea sp. JJY05]|uniref:hypothetical protein n=1 Tax=Nonomuraea sp. JJY05 TaxID=3350255 RepID=UPI00373E10AB
MVAPETLAQLTDAPEPHAIWVGASAGADPLKLVDDLDGLADTAGAQLEDQLQAQAAANRELDILTWSVLGLLGISVAIALSGSRTPWGSPSSNAPAKTRCCARSGSPAGSCVGCRRPRRC